MVSNSLRVASGSKTYESTCRRADRSPRLANVIMRSATRRASFALATVVSIRSCRKSDVTRLRSSARRCSCVRESFRNETRWRMVRQSLRRVIVQVGRGRGGGRLGRAFAHGARRAPRIVSGYVHAQSEAQVGQHVLDLLERLAAEVAVLQHLGLALLHQVADRLDVGLLETVRRAHRQLELLDGALELLAHLHLLLVDFLDRLGLDLLLEVDEQR